MNQKPGTVTLRIERIVAGGYGLARTPEGIVLVRGALPDEVVTARPVFKAGVLRAHAIEVLESNPARVSNPLPPGADLPLEYAQQLAVKEDLIREALSRVAKIDVELAPIHSSPRVVGYRTAAQYVVASDGLGARAIDSDRVVHLDADALVAEPIARAFAAVTQHSLHGIEEVVFRASLHEDRAIIGLIGAQARPAQRLARNLTGFAGVVWGESDTRGRFRDRVQVMEGTDRLLEDFGGILSTVAVQSFAQVNPLAAGALYREAAAIAAGGARALDLYAGSGVLGFHLAKGFEEVVAVEISADAVKRGEADARRLRSTLQFHRGDARSAARFFPADLVAVDPPRAGLSKDVLELLIEHAPHRILYVSCDPTTWARDLAGFCAHGYRVAFARPYDFYPFTHHVEVLSLLEHA